VKHYTVSADVTKVNTTIVEGKHSIRITNASAGILFWRGDRGAVDVTASNGTAMLAGSVETFWIDPTWTNISIILISGTAAHSVYFDTGEGM
jgi:hypothetical protein